MSNSKFILFIADQECRNFNVMTGARVFSHESLMAIHRAIQNGAFGHYSKKRYFLVDITSGIHGDEPFAGPTDEKSYQLYPNGGKWMNAEILRRLLPLTSAK